MTEILTTEHMFIADPTVFTVEKLLSKRKRRGSYEYLVKWRDYNFKFNTWEPESNILDQRLVDEFNEKCKDTPELLEEEDVYDSEMSDTENTSVNSKRKRVTRSSQKLRRRSKRVGKYEEIEPEIEERLSDEDDTGSIKDEKIKKKKKKAVKEIPLPFKEGKEETEETEIIEEDIIEADIIEEDEVPSEDQEDEDGRPQYKSSPSNVRNLRNKNTPSTFLTSKKRSSSSKFSDLMKLSRQQASTYSRHFVNKTDKTASTTPPPPPSSAKLSSEEGDDQCGSDDTTDSSKKSSKRSTRPSKKVSPLQQATARERYKKKCAEMSPDQVLVERAKARERMRVYREKKIKNEGISEEKLTSVRRRRTPRIGRKVKYKHKYAEMSPDQELEERAKARERTIIYREKNIEKQKQRKRPTRTCAVPTGFWDPVVMKPDGGDLSDRDEKEEEMIFRAQPKMKNHEPAPPSFYSCYSEDTDSPTTGCINDLGESIFPKKKFTLKPPILDISKKPISDFVFNIEDLWADKIQECSVEALGYSVKIYECKSAKPLFTKQTNKSTDKQLGT